MHNWAKIHKTSGKLSKTRSKRYKKYKKKEVSIVFPPVLYEIIKTGYRQNWQNSYIFVTENI